MPYPAAPNFINHIATYVCGGDADQFKLLMTLLAKKVQHPEQIRIRLLLRGPSGCGKTLMARILQDVLGGDIQVVDEYEFPLPNTVAETSNVIFTTTDDSLLPMAVFDAGIVVLDVQAPVGPGYNAHFEQLLESLDNEVPEFTQFLLEFSSEGKMRTEEGGGREFYTYNQDFLNFMHYQGARVLELDLLALNIGVIRKGAGALANAISPCINLEVLGLERNSLNGTEVRVLTAALGAKLINLNLSANRLGPVGCRALVEAFERLRALKSINIGYCDIGDREVKILAKGFPRCSTLTDIDLSGNSLTVNGVEALVDGLIQCAELQVVGLGYNKLLDDGAVEVARLLEHRPSLVQINLESNSIDARGITALAKVLVFSKAVQHIFLSNNAIENQAIASLFEKEFQSTWITRTVHMDLKDFLISNKPRVGLVAVMNYNEIVDFWDHMENTTTLRRFQPSEFANSLGSLLFGDQTEFLGKGSFGKVFRVVLNGDNEVYAAKLFVLEDDHGQKTMANELRATATMAVKHDNVLRYMGFCAPFTSDYRLSGAIIMEFAEHGSLHNIVESGQFKDGDMVTIDMRLNWARHVANGMKALHDINVIHRDLKCTNILLTSDRIAKIADFGCSVKMTKIMPTDVQDYVTVRVGALKWRAPELKDVKCQQNKMTDVFSYGCVLYELFSGKVPFEQVSDKNQYFELLASGVRANHRLYGRLIDDSPEVIVRTMDECWNADPWGRPLFTKIVKDIAAR